MTRTPDNRYRPCRAIRLGGHLTRPGGLGEGMLPVSSRAIGAAQGMASQPSMLAQAMAFAEGGVSVFPCVPGEKRPLTARGFLDASTDPKQIRMRRTARPTANIATPTGRPGFDVLDVDVHAEGSGWVALRRLQGAGLIDGWIRAVRTPSGGLHLHYPGTAQRNGSLPGLHVDFRGVGGHVLLPPSLIRTPEYARRYELLDRRDVPGGALDWAAVTQLLAPTPDRRVAVQVLATRLLAPVQTLAAHVARQPEGNRDNALFWAACRAAEAGVADLAPLVDAAIGAGLPERQARRTARSAQDTVARGPARPVSRPACAPSQSFSPTRQPESLTRSAS